MNRSGLPREPAVESARRCDSILPVVRLAVDFEHSSRTWWEAGGQDLWDGITEGFDGSQVVVDDDLAKSWLGAASAIEGWNEGPEYAPHPITQSTLAEDEPE